MSERRTYTLDDRAVGFLVAVPKELNSKFVSDLIISFFDGVDLLSYPDWYFLSSAVERDSVGGVLLQKSSVVGSNPIDQEKARLALVLSKLRSLDVSSYDSFCQFLALPEVRVGGLLEWDLGKLYNLCLRDPFFKGVSFPSGWLSDDRYSRPSVLNPEYTVEFALKKSVSLSRSSFGVSSFLSSLFEAVSNSIVDDLVFTREFGMTRVQFEAEKRKEDEKIRKEAEEKQREIMREELAEKERLEEEFEKRRAEFLTGVIAKAREVLSSAHSVCGSLFSRCEGELIVGYHLDSPGQYDGVGYPFGRPKYSPVFCKKHLLRSGSFNEVAGVLLFGGWEYVIVSKE